jgi:hypothetical protein
MMVAAGQQRLPGRRAQRRRVEPGVLRAISCCRSHGTHALGAPRKSLPSLLMVSRDLTKVLNDQYPKKPETQAYLDQLHSLAS